MAFCDAVYCEYILGIDILSKEAKSKGAASILSSFNGNHFIDPNDEKSHGGAHLTAYALATLSLLEVDIPRKIVNAVFDDCISSHVQYPAKLVDRLQFWRGSHIVGGKVSAMMTLKDMRLLDEVQLASLKSYISSWFSFYDREISENGLWYPIKDFRQKIFDFLYQIRHRPVYAKYGAAAHLYWIYSRMNRRLPNTVDLDQAISEGASLYSKSKILESTPYCLDFDVLFIINFLTDMKEPRGEVSDSDLFYEVGLEIYQYFLAHKPAWFHALPGALAALVECTKGSVRFRDMLLQDGIVLRDPFQRVNWL